MRDVYFMSPPRREWTLRGKANFRSQGATPVDAAAARREWLALARAIEARGGLVVVMHSPDPGLTGMPYAAEAGHIVTAGGAPRWILPRMAAPHRRDERRHWVRLARALGLEVVDTGVDYWEGQGDVAEFRGVTLLFHGGRTTYEGMRAAAGHFPGERLELEVRQPAFHGNMALLPLPHIDRLLVCGAVFPPASFSRLIARFGAECVIEVSEDELRQYATNGLPIGDTWIVPSVAPARLLAQVADAGMQIVRVPMPELCEKAGGASRCLVLHARLPMGEVLPPALALETAADDILKA